MEKFGSGRSIKVDILHKKCKLFEKWYNRSYMDHGGIEEIRECFNVFYTTGEYHCRWHP
jgi:hypothetical protein